MNSRFDHRSGNSSRSNPLRRGKQSKGSKYGNSSRREDLLDERGPYRSKNDRRGESQERREFPRNGSYRGSQEGQELKYGKENEKDSSRSRSLPRRFGKKGTLIKSSDQRDRSRPARKGNPVTSRKQLDTSLVEREVQTASHLTDSPKEPQFKDILWGRHATQAALEVGRPIHRIWCTPEIRNSQRFLQLLRDAKSSGVLVEEVSWARLGQLTNGAIHQGIVIQTAAAETLELQTLIEGCRELGEHPLLLALDGLTDPQNLGAIVRSAEAFGAHGLVLPQRRSAGLTGSVAKVAAGALEHLPVARVVNLNRSLEDLKQAGYQVVGLAEEGSVTLSEIELEGPLVVVAGSEDKGISLVTRRHCDQLVRIPLRGVTPSLNASVATAVFLYEVARNGWMKGLSGQDPSPRMVRAKCSSVSTENKESGFFKDENSNKQSDAMNVSDQVDLPSSSHDLEKETCLNLDLDNDSEAFGQSVHL